MHELREERTSFHSCRGRTGVATADVRGQDRVWEASNPSYEETISKDMPVGGRSPTGAGWVYPALFRTGDTWLLVSEGQPRAQLLRHAPALRSLRTASTASVSPIRAKACTGSP